MKVWYNVSILDEKIDNCFNPLEVDVTYKKAVMAVKKYFKNRSTQNCVVLLQQCTEEYGNSTDYYYDSQINEAFEC